MAGWWLSHPSEKYESVGIIIPNGKTKLCSKPPISTSIYITIWKDPSCQNVGEIHEFDWAMASIANCWHNQRVNLHFPMVFLWFIRGYVTNNQRVPALHLSMLQDDDSQDSDRKVAPVLAKEEATESWSLWERSRSRDLRWAYRMVPPR